jgi:GT2 family glycosyltransferase
LTTHDTGTVTVGVPVYRGERWIADALRSIQEQTHRDMRVVISVDGPQPECERLCAPFLSDERFRLVVQPERLGWQGNVAWLMSQVDTPFWCYHQQDDVLEPTYLATLFEHAEKVPEAAIVYCDIDVFGDVDMAVSQGSITGPLISRLLSVLTQPLLALPLRGLTRARALQEAGVIRPRGVECWAVDVVWLAAVARTGELHRVPARLYKKRWHGQNLSKEVLSWPGEMRRHAWVVHCVDMLEEMVLAEATPIERRLLWEAAVTRLLSPRIPAGIVDDDAFTAQGRRSMARAFVREARTRTALDIPAWLALRWGTIRRSTMALAGAPR